MGLINQAKPTSETKRRHRIMLYGIHGIGKSTFASKMPKPFCIQTEDGMQDIEGVDSLGICEKFEDAMAQLQSFAVDEHDYQTLVLDTADWMENLIIDAVCRDKQVENIGDIAFGKGPAAVCEKWREFLKGLEYVNVKRNAYVCILAHAKVERFNDPTSEPYDRYSPALIKQTAPILQEWCDEVLFANKEKFIETKDIGFDRERSRAIDGQRRLLYTEGSPAAMAKNRLGLPPEINLDWATFASYLPEFKQRENAQ